MVTVWSQQIRVVRTGLLCYCFHDEKAHPYKVVIAPLSRIRLQLHPLARRAYEIWCLRRRTPPLQSLAPEVLTSALVSLQVPVVYDTDEQRCYLAIGGFQAIEIVGALAGKGAGVRVDLKVLTGLTDAEILHVIDGDLFLHSVVAPAVPGEMAHTLLSQLSPDGASVLLDAQKATRARISRSTGIKSIARSAAAAPAEKAQTILEAILAQFGDEER